ncbi:MAG: sigma-54 interaction domain-containing protein [Nitrospirota bacterium]
MSAPTTDPAWVTGFLTSIVVDYLAERHPQVAHALPYPAIFADTTLAHRATDAKALLTDPNQWLPQDVLVRLVLAAEDATGDHDLAYHATRAHFERPHRRGPTIFEIIATLLDDVRGVVIASNRWAGAFATNTALQALDHADRPEATMLYMVTSKSRLTRLPGLFLRGQCEGFPALFGRPGSAAFVEEFTQLSLAHLLREFDDYELASQDGRLRVIERSSGAVVAEAEGVVLGTEQIPVSEHFPAEDGAIVAPSAGRYTVLTADGATKAPLDRAQAVRIVRGGSLSRGRVSVSLDPGAIYGAPYTKARFRWTNQRAPRQPAEARLREVSRLLFTHLHEIKQTQRRLLRSERDNASLREENAQLKSELVDRHRFEGLVALSPGMRALCTMLERVVDTDSTVLLLGETGTGKEVVARALHYNGPRKDGRFVAVNCGAIPEGLLESELFGHERGAFTGALQRRIGKFEAAHNGTLFLDEVGELSAALQVRLLRVLQERTICRVGGNEDVPVNIRVIAATHRNLVEMVKSGTFRQDLFYRLNVMPVAIPPLRERREDIPLLAQALLDKVSTRTGRSSDRFSPDALRVLGAHSWPGNVRELENVIERALILAGNETTVTAAHLPMEWFGDRAEVADATGDPWTVIGKMDWSCFADYFDRGGSFDDLLHRIEWAITERAVREHQGNKTHAARTLKRSYRWLRKLEKESLDPGRPSDA